MKFYYKLAGAFIALGLLLGGAFTLNYFLTSQPFDQGTTTDDPLDLNSYCLNENFTSQSLWYGPQGWAPYNSKLPLYPSGNIDTDNYYVMFVDLNATSNLTAAYPCVKVEYSFTGLEGDAAFHVYGFQQENGSVSWRNRIDGIGYLSGWYVTGSTTGGSQTQITSQPLADYNHVFVQVANKNGAAYNVYGDNTYYLKFDKVGGGLNTMHITASPTKMYGEVTQTTNQTGTFYVTYTGGKTQQNFILLVAVSGPITSDFNLNLKTSIPS